MRPSASPRARAAPRCPRMHRRRPGTGRRRSRLPTGRATCPPLVRGACRLSAGARPDRQAWRRPRAPALAASPSRGRALASPRLGCGCGALNVERPHRDQVHPALARGVLLPSCFARRSRGDRKARTMPSAEPRTTDRPGARALRAQRRPWRRRAGCGWSSPMTMCCSARDWPACSSRKASTSSRRRATRTLWSARWKRIVPMWRSSTSHAAHQHR